MESRIAHKLFQIKEHALDRHAKRWQSGYETDYYKKAAKSRVSEGELSKSEGSAIKQKPKPRDSVRAEETEESKLVYGDKKNRSGKKKNPRVNTETGWEGAKYG